MIKGKTSSGFNYTISDSSLNNFELLEVMGEVDKNPLLIPKMVLLLLGEKQKTELLNHLRTTDGTVPNDVVSNEIMEMIKGSKKTKN